MIRRADWPARLAAYLAVEAGTPFVPGTSDCALFAAGAVAAMTGSDPAARWRGRYSTARGGLRVLRREGYADAVAVAAALLRRRAEGERAVPGDVCALETPDQAAPGAALGIVQGAFVYVRGAEGLGLVHLPPGAPIFEVPL